MRTVIIDGDILIFQVAVNAENATQFEDDIWVLWADAKIAKNNIDEAIEAIVAKTDADDYIMAITSPNNFRKDVLPSYKSNRTSRKPMLLQPLRQHVFDHHINIMIDGLEGDDVIGIVATRPNDPVEYVMYSADKDMKTIPAPLWDEEDGMAITITEEQADRYWLFQTLTGDTTDGYKGLPRCGPVGANKILDKECTYQAVEEAYIKAGFTARECLQQARCARILRSSDFNETTQQPILWSPEYESE